MPAPNPLFQEVYRRVEAVTRPIRLRKAPLTRLALLITGLVAAKGCILQQVATELDVLGLTRATQPESIGRRLRRTLSDERLDPATCYRPVLPRVIDWDGLRGAGGRVFLICDESSKAEQLHLLAVDLAYWGTSLPLAWEVWEQNAPLPDGTYWERVEAALAGAAGLLPRDLVVILLADRAYDIPPFVDRVAARDWHWVVRCKAASDLRFRDRRGRECRLGDLVRRHVPRPGRRWKARGWAWKDAGWRTVSVVAVWEAGQEEPLVLLTDLPPRWKVARWYDRRFWTEPGFRTRKSRGWRWEESQVRGVGHNRRLLLGMAWATLLALCVGVEAAQEALRRLARRARRRRPVPQHARQSIFTLGLGRVRRWLYRTATRPIRWRLPEVDALGWNDRWCRAQAPRPAFKTVRP
jgi:hypothetical protein